jgi:hypothetical protein
MEGAGGGVPLPVVAGAGVDGEVEDLARDITLTRADPGSKYSARGAGCTGGWPAGGMVASPDR